MACALPTTADASLTSLPMRQVPILPAAGSVPGRVSPPPGYAGFTPESGPDPLFRVLREAFKTPRLGRRNALVWSGWPVAGMGALRRRRVQPWQIRSRPGRRCGARVARHGPRELAGKLSSGGAFAVIQCICFMEETR